MKHEFVKLAMAGLLAGFCVSATAASSATSETAVVPEQAVEQIVALEVAEEATNNEEIAMAKCSKDAESCDAPAKSCKEEKPKPCSKSAAQKAMGN
jgi:hypothetical protein